MQPASLRVALGGGINTKLNDKTVPSAELLRAENVVFDELTSLRKRNGYVALSSEIDDSAELLEGAIKMGSRGSERLVFTRDRCFSRMTGTAKWSDVGAVYSVRGSDRPLVKNGSQQTMSDCATNRGVTVVAWEDSQGGVWWSTVDEAGNVFRAATQADASGISPRCVTVGNNLHVYYLVTTTLHVVVIDPASPAVAVAPVILVDDVDSVYDACPTNRTGAPGLLAYLQSGTKVIRVGYVDQSGAISGPLFGQPSILNFDTATEATEFRSGSPIAVSYLHVDGENQDRVVVAYATGIFIQILFFFGDFSVEDIHIGHNDLDSFRIALSATLDVDDITQVWMAVEENDSNASEHRVAFSLSKVGIGVIDVKTLRSVGIVSRSFMIDDRAFVNLVHDTSFFNVYLTYRIDHIDTPVPVGRLVPGSAAGLPARKHVTSANVVDDVARFCLPVRDRVISETGSDFRETGIRMFDLDFDDTDTHQAAQLGAGLYLAGACPMHYDGLAWTEQGFHVGPELIVATPGAGGSMTASTTYEYRVWYEWTDTQGEVHLGPTSPGTLVTMGVGQTQVTLTLPTLRLTLKDRVRICVARSLSAKTGKTAQLFRVTSLDPSTDGDVNGAVINNTAVDTLTFIDRMSDADLDDQEELYTDGGIFSNDPTQLGHVVVRHKDRLLFSDPGNPFLLRFSQPLNGGFGLEIPPDLFFPVDPFGGAITAVASQDDRGIIWQERAIRFFAGDGPEPNGNTATIGFTSPQLATSDVGCTNPASIVLTPRGYMFQSDKGIYNIGTDGSISYIGARVEGFNNQNITRAVLLPNRTAVLFLTDSGLSLIYDYQRDSWSTATNHEGLDALVVDDQLYYLRTDGSTVYQETPGEHSDAGLPIRILIATAWIHMQEHLQGFQKFLDLHIIGSWLSPHQLGVQHQTDYTAMFGDPVWLDATGDTSSVGWITGATAQRIGEQPILGTGFGDGDFGEGPFGGTPDDVYQWRVQLLEKGEAIQLVFTDFEKPGTFGPGFKLTELLITGGIKGPAPKPFTKGRSI